MSSVCICGKVFRVNAITPKGITHMGVPVGVIACPQVFK